MATIIAVANWKGGAGKTTTAVNLSAALADRQRRVLTIDCDPQGGATFAVGLNPATVPATLYDVIRGVRDESGPTIRDVQVALDDYWAIVPATLDLANAELELQQAMRRENILADALVWGEVGYDYVILDCPPSVSLLTLNALTAAQRVLIPCPPEPLGTRGLGLIHQTIQMVRKARLNAALTVWGVLITRYDKQVRIHQDQAAEIEAFAAHFHLRVLGRVPATVRVQEAAGAGVPLTRYGRGNGARAAYEQLAADLITNWEGADA